MSGVMQKKKKKKKIRPSLSTVVYSGSASLRMLHVLYCMCLQGKIRDVCVYIYIYTYCLNFWTYGDII